MIPRSALAEQQRGLLILGELTNQIVFLLEKMLEDNTLALLDLSEVEKLVPEKKPVNKVAKQAPKPKKSKKR